MLEYIDAYYELKRSTQYNVSISLIKAAVVAIIVAVSAMLATLLQIAPLDPQQIIWLSGVAALVKGVENFVKTVIYEKKDL